MNVRPGLIRWLATALLALSTAGALESPPPNDRPMADCSLSHPQLPGRCSVTVPVPRHSTPQQACQSVVNCMNATICADAQKYCPNPGVSKDWKLAGAEAARPRVNCAFSNGGYSGWCRISTPLPKGATPQQVCEAMASCLNGAHCEGFVNYCQPEIVSGWKVTEAKPAAPPAAPKH